MSRTFRRKPNRKTFDKDRYDRYMSYNTRYHFGDRWMFDHDAKVKRIAEVVFHTDAGTVRFKEPGPSWYRNLYVERPTRRYNKLELKKYMADPEYEPMVESMGKLVYWT